MNLTNHFAADQDDFNTPVEKTRNFKRKRSRDPKPRDGFMSVWKYQNEVLSGRSHQKVGEHIRDLFITQTISGICKGWRGLHINVVREGDIRFKCPHVNCKRNSIEWRSVKNICEHIKGQHFDEHCQNDKLDLPHHLEEEEEEEEEEGEEEVEHCQNDKVDFPHHKNDGKEEEEQMGEEENKNEIDNLRNEVKKRLKAVMRYMICMSVNEPLFKAGCSAIAEIVLDDIHIRETIRESLEKEKSEEEMWRTELRGDVVEEEDRNDVEKEAEEMDKGNDTASKELTDSFTERLQERWREEKENKEKEDAKHSMLSAPLYTSKENKGWDSEF